MTGCAGKAAAMAFAAAALSTGSIDLRAQVKDGVHQHELSTRAEGPPVTLRSVLAEALDNNPELAALRDLIAVAQHRPAQERGLMPPTAEAQIWQWPINSLNPWD